MANKAANAATGGGLFLSALLLATPLAPLALPSAAGMIVARICRKMKDDQIEREERENYNYNSRRSETMSNNYPVLFDSLTRNAMPSYGSFNSFPVVTTSPETELARFSPKLGADVLLKQSMDRALANLANSSLATEFAIQGRGVRGAIVRRKEILGITFSKDITEFFFEPI